MADSTQEVRINTGDEFDRIVLETTGDDVMAMAQSLADKLDPAKQDEKQAAEAEAKAKADAEAKAKEEAEAKAKADADAAAKAAADAASASAGKDTKVDGVLLRDGKHVAPFAVLEEARGRASAERAAREEAEAKAKELQAELDKLKGGKTDTAEAQVLTEDLQKQIAALKEAAPELGEVLDPLVKTVAQMNEQVQAFRARDEQRQREAEAEINRSVQDAIDANPKLTWAQSHDKATWNRIADQDAILRADPANRNLTFSDRFGMAVKAVEAIYGEIKLPAEFQPNPGSDKAAAEAAAKAKAEADAKAKADADAKAKAEADAKAQAGIQPEDAKARAEAELKRAQEAGNAKPFTLTDIPGGTPPESADRALDQTTPDEVAAKVDKFLAAGGRVQDIPGLFTT